MKTRRLWWMLAVGIVTAPAIAHGAEEPPEMGPPGKERRSRPGEAQEGARPAPPPKLPRMDPKRPPPPVRIGGKIQRMEDQLDKPQPVRPGERQPELDASRMATPEKGRGAQKPKGPSAPPEGQHVRLVLRITEAGDSEVVGVAQLPGRAVLSEVGTGDFVVEVVSDGSTIAAQAIPDPFERRSFAGPEGSPIQGHHVERAKTATVTIRVPDMTLGTPGLERLSVRFYKVRPGTPISKIDASEMRRLREENRLERRFEIPASRLAPQIRERARAPKIE